MKITLKDGVVKEFDRCGFRSGDRPGSIAKDWRDMTVRRRSYDGEIVGFDEPLMDQGLPRLTILHT